MPKSVTVEVSQDSSEHEGARLAESSSSIPSPLPYRWPQDTSVEISGSLVEKLYRDFERTLRSILEEAFEVFN